MSCGVGHRRGSDPMLLWLWCRLEATALIRPLAWELSYAVDAALKGQKKKRKKERKKEKREVAVCEGRVVEFNKQQQVLRFFSLEYVAESKV